MLNNPNSLAIITPHWQIPNNIHAITTTRRGGFSTHNFASLNLATHVADNNIAVLKNRNKLQTMLPSPPIWLNQTHSNIVSCYDDFIPNSIGENIITCDAIYTTQTNVVLPVLTADCVPILLTNQNADFIAVIHAGWTGLLHNIIGNTIHAICLKLKLQPHDFIAYIGVAICQNHFEIGTELYDAFKKQNSQYLTFMTKGNLPDKYLLDLKLIAKYQLQTLGINFQNIYVSQHCTYCNNELFFSYRKEKITGRFATMIWKETVP